MKNKKGFTLIELLAVIVILAVIMVIAIPKILDIIENSKKSAAKSSAELYIDAINKNNTLSEVNSALYTKIEDGEDIDVQSLDIKLKGEGPSSGTVTIEKGKVTTANLCMNDYKVAYNGKEVIVKGTDCDSEILVIESFDVSFTPSNSEWKVSTVEEALNDLYKYFN